MFSREYCDISNNTVWKNICLQLLLKIIIKRFLGTATMNSHNDHYLINMCGQSSKIAGTDRWPAHICSAESASFKPYEVHNKRFEICWNKGPILHTVICIYILYEICIQIVYIIFTRHTFWTSELMYTKCIQNVCIQSVCIQNASHISTNFCIQNV